MVRFAFDLDKVEEYDWMHLEEGEEIEIRKHPSLIPIIPEILVTLFIAVSLIYSTLQYWDLLMMVGKRISESHPYIILLVPLAALFILITDILISYVRVKATFYVFTNDKFVVKREFVTTDTKQIPYSKVQDYDMNVSSIFEKLLNLGTISIASAGTGKTEVELEDFPNPSEAIEVLSEYT